MSLNRFILVLAIALCAATCGKNAKRDASEQVSEKYAQIVALLNAQQEPDVTHLKQVAVLLNSKPYLMPVQADTVRTLFHLYQQLCADAIAQRTENDLDIISHSGNRIRSRMNALIQDCDTLTAYGIQVYIAEGMVQTEILPLFEIQVFDHYITPCERAIARLQQIEAEDPSQEDESIIVDMTKITQRLAACDSMMITYANDTLLPVIDDMRMTYLAMLMYGTDNTPAFDWQGNHMNAPTRAAIKSYVTQYPAAFSTPLLKTYLALLQTADFNRNSDIDIFISQTFAIQ